jgi:hypothetical protein|tara:strand:+ start:6907 stop:7035 length:129 start_codon:yes stop_codon:yes gene_type:complete
MVDEINGEVLYQQVGQEYAVKPADQKKDHIKKDNEKKDEKIK